MQKRENQFKHCLLIILAGTKKAQRAGALTQFPLGQPTGNNYPLGHWILSEEQWKTNISAVGGGTGVGGTKKTESGTNPVAW